MVMVPKGNGKYFKKEDKMSSFHQSKVVKRGQCKNIHNTKQEWFVWILMLYVLCSTSITYMYLNYGKKEPFLEEIVHLGDINMFRKFSYAHVIYEGKLFDVLKISKHKFGFTSLMHLGHDIGGVKLKENLSKLYAIVDCSMPKIVILIKGFLGAAKFWRRVIVDISSFEAPWHALSCMCKFFQWGGKQQEACVASNEKISSIFIYALSNLKGSFEFQGFESNFTILFHSEDFHGVKIKLQ